MKEAEARKAEADALRFAMEQEAEGIRAKGLAEAEAIEKKAEAQPQDKTEPAAPAEDDPFEDIFKIFNRGK